MDVTENVSHIKMESSELSSRYSTEEKCLRHEETVNLLESCRKILEERQVRDDDEISNNTITVSVGPQFEGDISILSIREYFCQFCNFKFEINTSDTRKI